MRVLKSRIVIIGYKKITRLFDEMIREKDWGMDFTLYDWTPEETARRVAGLQEADVIVSAGTHATVLKEHGDDVPVVRVEITGFDIIHAIQRAKQQSSKAVFLHYKHPIPQYETARFELSCS
ncbi:hypothetical protein GXN76_14460 [Kroppenstedtia pulmonis]|uniref:Signal transduction response regulator propionate catabolism activator N-terminal domain-containing protein n=1 Tax=Kroppenstedtia pulmonis TaxID=1380685 RepID=A0A7D4C8G2_9BACL|nr:PrpR N-terminal domain-containing protein [Kroppenstedtia pulmonis]QKG85536.1 hypothetical protein GXN76_14460 [Kroppenstedtia pulmonis]